MAIIFAKSINNHGLTIESCFEVMYHSSATKIGTSREGSDKLAWVDFDNAGKLIEVIAIDFKFYLYVIHLKPVEEGSNIDEIKKRLF
jgi:hypothetical protein